MLNSFDSCLTINIMIIMLFVNGEATLACQHQFRTWLAQEVEMSIDILISNALCRAEGLERLFKPTARR